MKHGKKYIESAKLIERSKLYDPDEAVKLALQTAKTKFDETLEISVRLGVDPRQADQQVRGAVVLPNGTGKKAPIIIMRNRRKNKKIPAQFIPRNRQKIWSPATNFAVMLRSSAR